MTSEVAARTRVRSGLVVALAGVVMFSFTLPVTKVALRGYDPVVIAMGRAVVAGMIALVVLAVVRAPWPGRAALWPLIATGLGIVMGFPLLTTIALQSTTSAHAAVVIAALPIATAVFAVLRAGERPSRDFWIAAVCGALALTVFALTRGGAEGASLLADLLLAGAVLAAAFGYVEGAVLTRQMPGWQVISWVLVVMLPVTVVLTTAAAVVGGGPADPALDSTLALLYLALVSMYLGFFAWYAGLNRAGVAHASQVQLIQPLLTLLWSALLLGEVIGWPTVVASVAVLGCVVWTQRSRAAKATELPTPEAP